MKFDDYYKIKEKIDNDFNEIAKKIPYAINSEELKSLNISMNKVLDLEIELLKKVKKEGLN